MGVNEEEIQEQTKTWLTYCTIAYFLSILAALALFVGAYRTHSGTEMNLPMAPEKAAAILAVIATLAGLAFLGATPEGIKKEGSMGFSAFASIFGGGLAAYAAFKANKAASEQPAQDAPTVEISAPPAAAPAPPPPSDDGQEG